MKKKVYNVIIRISLVYAIISIISASHYYLDSLNYEKWFYLYVILQDLFIKILILRLIFIFKFCLFTKIGFILISSLCVLDFADVFFKLGEKFSTITEVIVLLLGVSAVLIGAIKNKI